jgi:hypothetical protein
LIKNNEGFEYTAQGQLVCRPALPESRCCPKAGATRYDPFTLAAGWTQQLLPICARESCFQHVADRLPRAAVELDQPQSASRIDPNDLSFISL